MKQKPNTFVQILSFICILLGSIALSIFYISSWANSLIFNTNYYLSTISSLPKNDAVAKALSTYTVDAFFQNIDVEEKIRTALPDQASFIAPQLADQLQSRSYQRATQVIESDQFTSVWVAANTVFHEKVLSIVRGGGILSQLQQKPDAKQNNIPFDASQLAQTIKNKLGSENKLFTDAQIDKFKSIVIPVYTKLENIRQIVYWISQATLMLLPASLALILFGIAIAFSRRQALLTAGITITILMIITLITLQIIKAGFVDLITQSVYHDAAGAVWDIFLKYLKLSLWMTILGGLIIILLSALAGSYRWAIDFRKSTGIDQIQKSTFSRDFTNLQVFLAKYKLWFILSGILAAVILLFSIQNLTVAAVIAVLSYLLLYIAILFLLFPRLGITQRR